MALRATAFTGAGTFGMRSAGSLSTPGLAVLEPGERGELLEAVLRLDAPHRAGAGAHDERVGQRAVLRVADAAEQGAAGDARGRDEDVVAGDEVVRVQHARRVEAGVEQPLPLLVVARPEAALDPAAQA